MPTTFLFAGGGTGGHLFPGIAVADELRRRDPDARIVFVGSSRTIESTIVTGHGLEHRTLAIEPFTKLKQNPLWFLWCAWRSVRQAIGLLNELRPAAVIGLGGFASAPVVWIAGRRRIPVILLEQNVIPGKTTRWLSRSATAVCIAFGESRTWLKGARKVLDTGNPVRSPVAELHGAHTERSGVLDNDVSTPELLILGGSQGADSLNAAVLQAISKLTDSFSSWKIIHQTGPRQVEQVRQTYISRGLTAVVEPFFHDLPQRYAHASLVISRAGATTLAELSCAGVAMILLPYPAAADDHQRANARVFVDHGAAIMIEHIAGSDRVADELAFALKKLADDPKQRQKMGLAAKQLARPDAAHSIAQVISDAVDHR